ncbi:MAG: MaoC family dehydratase [Gaiellaceae bacterium]
MQELSSSPSMRVLYPKAALGMGRSVLGKLPGVGGGERALPDEELALNGVEIDRDHLAAYDRVCEFRLRDEVPATYPHMLTFPLAMKLMTDSSFPFGVVGLVHIENRIEQTRPIRADEVLDLRVWAANMGEHDKGTQFEMHAEANAGGETPWRSVSTYLHREGGGSSGDRKRDDEEHTPPNAVWKLPGDIGRRYAGVSGDRNPIHMHPITARLFGMPRPIAHGMWLKARCLAALDGVLPDAFEVDVRFKLPVYIPGKVSFASEAGAGGERRFSLRDGKNEKPHLDGVAKPI